MYCINMSTNMYMYFIIRPMYMYFMNGPTYILLIGLHTCTCILLIGQNTCTCFLLIMGLHTCTCILLLHNCKQEQPYLFETVGKMKHMHSSICLRYSQFILTFDLDFQFQLEENLKKTQNNKISQYHKTMSVSIYNCLYMYVCILHTHIIFFMVMVLLWLINNVRNFQYACTFMLHIFIKLPAQFKYGQLNCK